MRIPEELIRQRSYEIWQREGCPQGMALQHWFRAKMELESEFRLARFIAIPSDYREVVSPRPAISCPPRKMVASRLNERHRVDAA